MERDVKPIFGAIGIQFVGRNYAMGGEKSAPEISTCFEQVFGSDVDVSSWDYAMTDGGDTWRLVFDFTAFPSSNKPTRFIQTYNISIL